MPDDPAPGPRTRPDGVAKLAPPPPSATARPNALLALALAALLLALAVGAAAATDPRNELWGPLPGSRFRPLVADWPAEKLDRFDRLAAPPATLVMGTSRGMALPPNATGGPGEAFNLAFPGGEVAVVRALYASLAVDGRRPERVVYALDQWSLRDHREDRVAESSERARLGGQAPSLGDRAAQLASTLSLPYLQDVARSAGYAFGSGYPDPGFHFAADGSMRYPAFEAPGYDQADHIALGIRELDSAFGVNRAIDPEAQADLDAFLAEASGNGTLVQVVLPPLHPQALAHLQDNPRFRAFTETTVDTVRRHCGPRVQLHDLTDPASIGADPADFYDSHHPYLRNGARILEAVADGHLDACRGGHA
ncbi:MAG TPA: hypothetical protein VM286_06945 [Candidatus Thermoplasmatota archaeon]|nr:hypothetical protein [Candidatus Thermoplasmatota archaeon]